MSETRRRLNEVLMTRRRVERPGPEVLLVEKWNVLVDGDQDQVQRILVRLELYSAAAQVAVQ